MSKGKIAFSLAVAGALGLLGANAVSGFGVKSGDTLNHEPLTAAPDMPKEEGHKVLLQTASMYTRGDAYAGILVSALLRSEKNGALVQCHFFEAASPAANAETLDKIKKDVLLKEKGDYLGVADALRPAKNFAGGDRVELGSCVPYETELPSAMVEALRNVGRHEDTANVISTVVVGHGDIPAASLFWSWGVESVSDPVRENRLQNDAGLEKFFPEAAIDWMHSSFVKAGAPACDNTGDLEMASKIMKAYSERPDRIVYGIKLRANCP